MDNQRFRINTPTVTHETIDGEAVIINLESGNYYSLIESGSLIWALLEKGASASEVQNLVQQAYQGNATDIDRSVQELLVQLQQENLIVPVDEATAVDLTEVLPAQNSDEKPSFSAPALNKFSDMKELLLLDPIHDVDDAGWPKPVPNPPE